MKFILLILIIAGVAFAGPDKNYRAKERELEILRDFLHAARDSLQNEMAGRWRAKQRMVEQREIDKEELVRYREKQERIHSDLARIKEECFAKEKTIEDMEEEIKMEREEWQFLNSALEDVFEKEAKGIIEAFPVDVEQRRSDLEEIRRAYKKNGNPGIALDNYVEYRKRYLEKGKELSIGKQTVIPNDGSQVELTIARFGNAFGYGICPAESLYTIRQTGKLGVDRFAIDKVGETELAEFLRANYPKWVEKQKPLGNVTIDVLQNAQSKVLISGQKVTTFDKFMMFVKAGGPIMIPMFILIMWAFVLVIWKLIQFSGKHRSNSKLSKVVIKHLEKSEIAQARTYAETHKGVVARVVRTCLDHSRWNRSSAEKAVREILVEEVPLLNKHLSTLAVIAGAAPLLGLLGTVTGMINLFEVITNYGTGDPKILAGGISEALITTQMGLIIAVPILLVHNYLRNRTNHIQSEMEKQAIRILNRLWPEA
ncbi:MAG: MotA/TolQ/ExbB proton channel family protein [Chitinispirillaceae bacterium]